MSKDELRCDSLQFSLHNLQFSLSRCKSLNEKRLKIYLDRWAPPKKVVEHVTRGGAAGSSSGS